MTKSRLSRISPWLLALGLISCTRPNPLACSDGACSDPAAPFCDLNGEIAGTPKTCIAATCVPGAFAACRDDQTAIVCNSEGNNFALVHCALSCAGEHGCQTCTPDRATCTDGVAHVCSADGGHETEVPCVLGCADDEPRCLDIVPSNALASYWPAASAAPELVLRSATLYVPSGRIVEPKGERSIGGTLVPAGDVDIFVIPVRSLTVHSLLSIQEDAPALRPHGVAFVVDGNVDIEGAIRLVGRPGAGPPGSIASGPCVGEAGNWLVDSGGYFAGGGGGGGATAGGNGGANFFAAARGGISMFNPALQPLRGGCAGGTPPDYVAGYGGGAIQITSRTSIVLAANASIEANGYPGTTFPPESQAGDWLIPNGGGSGGGILLEAPTVTLGAGVLLLANGGAGASGDHKPGTTPSGRTPSRGAACTSYTDICTAGGDGGWLGSPARAAAAIPYTGQQQLLTGGGGGAAGHIRINTASGTYLKANDTFESPAASAGHLVVR